MDYLKVGDKIKVIYNDNGTQEYVGQERTIERVDANDFYCYKLRGINSCFSQQEVQLISMNKLNAMLKRLLDADSQTLYKAGYINGNLELTDKGNKALSALVFDANKATLVKSAQEDLDEEAKEKN